MYIIKKLAVAALILLPLTQAAAADCSNARTQREMNQCATTAYKAADKALNAAYQQVLKQTSGEQKSLLQSAQKKWIGYRDADCLFQAFTSRDGTMNAMNTAACLQTKTEQRTRELKAMLNCPEGDVSCPL